MIQSDTLYYVSETYAYAYEDAINWINRTIALIGTVSTVLVALTTAIVKAYKKIVNRTQKLLDDFTIRERMEVVRLAQERAEIKGVIYGELYDILYELEASRVSIFQPHPEHEERFISTSFEVVNPRAAIPRLKDYFQWKKIDDWRCVDKVWRRNPFMYFPKQSSIKDEKLNFLFMKRQNKTVVYVKLENSAGLYKGTICIEWVVEPFQYLDKYKNYLKDKALLIANQIIPYEPITEEPGKGVLGRK